MLTIFYRNPRLLVLTIGLIIVAGSTSLMVTPRMEDPLLTPRAGTITTFLPGADAERMEALVTEKIEDELKEIEEIKEVRSSSRSGVSFIAIELRDDVDEAEARNIWARTRDKAADAALLLPQGASKPEFEQLDVKAYALIVGLRWTAASEPSYGILRRMLKQLKDRIDAVSGTEKSNIYGDPQEEILVTVRPEAAAAINLNAMDLAAQIQASDSKVSAGQLRSDSKEMLLEVSGELDTLTRVAKIPVQFGSSSNFVTLSDIATIEKTVESPPSSQVLLKDQPAIALGVLVRAQTRLDKWTQEVNPILDEFRKELPPGIEFEIVFEQNRYVTVRMDTLFQNLLSSAAAVFLVVLFMMGWRSAIIISSSLPLGCLAVLAFMHWLSIPIHQMSITGLIIALGLMIDNAIVIVDEIWQKISKGASSTVAISETTTNMAVPLLGSTLTTALSFGPIALMPGPAGEFVGSIAVVTILAICSTFVLALTVVSALAAFGLRAKTTNDGFLRNGWSNHSLTKGYERLTRWVYSHPALGAVSCVLLSVLGLTSILVLPEQFFPPADRNQFQIELELPVTSSLAETESVVKSVRASLLQEDGIKDVAWFIGESAPVFYYNVIPDRKNAPRYGQAIVDCQEGVDTRALIHRVQEKLDRIYPDVTCLVRQLEQGPPFSAPIEIRLFGPDTDRLRDLGEQIRYVMTQTPHIIHTRSELSETLPKVTFAVDEQQARLAGLSNTSIASALNSALEGTQGGSIVEATEELPVRVRVSSASRGDLNKIASIDLTIPATGQTLTSTSPNDYRGIPLSAISSLRLDSDVSGINRLNGRRMNEVQAFITAGVLPSEVLHDLTERLKQSGFELPVGYTQSFGGAEAERDDAIGNLIANTSILLALMVATLVLAFGSFRLAGLIWIVAGLSVGLGLGSLWLAGYPWGFMCIVGIMGMIGVAINDSIVVLSSLKSIPESQRGDANAILDVMLHNVRHVLTTTFTTIVGFAPLIISGGEFWPPVAVSISGGVGGATLLALFFVPCVFILINRRSTKADAGSVTLPNKSVSLGTF